MSSATNNIAILTDFTNILQSYSLNSSAFESGDTAQPGQAGLLGSRQLDANGWEADQQRLT